MEEFFVFGIDGGVQPLSLVVDPNLVQGDLIRDGAGTRLYIGLQYPVVNSSTTLLDTQPLKIRFGIRKRQPSKMELNTHINGLLGYPLSLTKSKSIHSLLLRRSNLAITIRTNDRLTPNLTRPVEPLPIRLMRAVRLARPQHHLQSPGQRVQSP